MQTTASAFAVNVQRLAKAIHAADYILLGAGAGLSAAAGLSYADEAVFQQRYPYWAARRLAQRIPDD